MCDCTLQGGERDWITVIELLFSLFLEGLRKFRENFTPYILPLTRNLKKVTIVREKKFKPLKSYVHKIVTHLILYTAARKLSFIFVYQPFKSSTHLYYSCLKDWFLLMSSSLCKCNLSDVFPLDFTPSVCILFLPTVCV
jgi:hypothetical protein